jgi:hypothetical protein
MTASGHKSHASRPLAFGPRFFGGATGGVTGGVAGGATDGV